MYIKSGFLKGGTARFQEVWGLSPSDFFFLNEHVKNTFWCTKGVRVPLTPPPLLPLDQHLYIDNNNNGLSLCCISTVFIHMAMLPQCPRQCQSNPLFFYENFKCTEYIKYNLLKCLF